MDNNNTSKEEYLSEKQKLEKKELLLKLKKEIDEMESSIKHVGVANAKIRTKKYLKISARLLRFMLPYLAVGTILTGAFCYTLNTKPFHRDYVKRNLQRKTTLESNGHVSYVETYDKFSSTEESLEYYGRWQKGEDGFYSRSVRTYNVDDLTIEKVLDLFDKFNQDEKLTLEDILGKPTSNKKETSNYLTEKDMKEAYLKVILYDQNNNEYIMAKETIEEDLVMSIFYILLFLIFEYLTFNLVNAVNRNAFDKLLESIRIIEADYRLVDAKSLSKKLEIKRDNYDRLTR